MNYMNLTPLYLARLGMSADICERRLTRVLTKDLFGLFDIVAMDLVCRCIWGVQVTSRKCFRDHKEKASTPEAIEKARMWIASGGRIMFVIWKDMQQKQVTVYEMHVSDGEAYWEIIPEYSNDDFTR